MDAFPTGPPASTQVLTNTDLLHVIVPLNSSAKDSYLARCASICRTFHGPAIRVLWRHLYTLLPLWHLLAPANTPYPFGCCDDDGTTDNILLEYLQKVDYLQHLSPAIRDATCRIVQNVVMQNGGNPFLLHTILWRGRRPMRHGVLIPFFTSTLRHAAFNFLESADTTIVRLLRRLCEFSPFLEEITIYRTLDRDTGPLVIQELHCFTHLHQLRMSRISTLEAFIALVTNPHLTHLAELEVVGPWVALGPTISVHNLRELSVKGDLPTISGIFSLVRFSALYSANICLDFSAASQLAEPTSITTLLALSYNAVSTSDLQSFEFHAVDHNLTGESHPTVPFFRDLLAPIIPLRSLRSFGFPAWPGDIATFLRALVAAWPKLERLNINFAYTSSVSLEALHYIYTRLKDLKELSVPHICFPAVGVHEIPAPLDLSPLHPLRSLSVGGKIVTTEMLSLLGSKLSDEGAEAVARYLLDLFPCLYPQQYRLAVFWSQSSHWEKLPPDLHFDDQWNRVAAHIYSISSVPDAEL